MKGIMEIQKIASKYSGCSFIISLLFFVGCIRFSEQADTMDKMKVVKDKIFKNYDKSIRPTNGTNSTDVYSAFMPRQILDFDEEKGIFTLDSYMYMQWLDPRLQWNTSDYDGYLQIKGELLWLPDITVYNSHSAQVDPTHDVLLTVHNSGYVMWFPPVLTQTSCPVLEQTSYPYDEVECVIVLGAWAHDGWEINYAHDNLELYEFLDIHSRWELISSKSYAERNETYYECCNEPYLSIHIHIALKRRPVPEVEATRAPCILAMILTLTLFWLPVDSSKKIFLGGIVFLTLNVLLIYVAGRTSNPLAVLYGVSFIQTAMYLVTITLLLQVFVVIKIASLSGPSRPPAFIVSLLSGAVGRFMFLRSSLPEDKMPLDQMQLKEESMMKETASAKEEWKMFATALDRALFFVMIVVMIAVHHI